MDFSEALQELRKGEEIYRNDDFSILLDNYEIKMRFNEDTSTYYYNASQEDILADDWKIKEWKPKEEVKLHKHKKHNEHKIDSELEEELEDEGI
jgi:hypothetical protein